MKKMILISLSLSVSLLLVSQTAYAAKPITQKLKTLSQVGEKKANASTAVDSTTKTEKASENLKTKAVREIDRRVASLQKIKTKVITVKKLSAATKSELTKDIDSEIANLQALKTKIQNETNSESLKAEVKSIVDSYRIYALYMPKVHLLIGADVTLQAVEKMTTLSTKLEAKISDAKAAGNDVVEIETLLKDMNAQINTAKATAIKVTSDVSALEPEGYPGNKTILQSARKDLQSAHRSLQLAHKDGQKIVQGLKTFTKTTKTTDAENEAPSAKTTKTDNDSAENPSE